MTLSDSPVGPLSTDRAPDCIRAGADYLTACLQDDRIFATLIDENAAIPAAAIRAFLTSPAGAQVQVVRLPAPTDSAHGFLEAVLVELGLEPFESSVDDLKQVLRMVFRQVSAASRRCVIIIEQAHEFGPRVFEAIRDLGRPVAGMTGTPLFVLTGPAALGRILDSLGMAAVAHLTRERFLGVGSADGTRAVKPDPAGHNETPVPEAPPSLVVTQGDKVIGEAVRIGSRVIIGRTAHNDVVLPSHYVSRHHAMIINGPDGAVLLDLKSTNGTYVNSRAVRSRVLRDGDWINIGNFRLRFRDGRQPAFPPAAPLDESLGETLVMRSIGVLSGEAPADAKPGSASSA